MSNLGLFLASLPWSAGLFSVLNSVWVELEVSLVLGPAIALKSERFRSSTIQSSSSELMYFATQSLKSAIVFGRLFERDLLKYWSLVLLSKAIMAEKTIRSFNLKHSLLNEAIKALSGSSLSCCILSRLRAVFFGIQLEAKWKMNSRANSLTDLIELGFKITN